ncbi:hypothetical protein [Brachybacterium hainanense]|uniref:Uncharacterized protein n=1 Tax=Brachybacterium hainanense TaxID=1541174 RepID=A0ABV6R6B7_9MICO
MSDVSRPAAQAAEDRARSLPLRRSVTATWWYVASGIVFFELCLVLLIVAGLAAGGTGRALQLGIGLAGIAWGSPPG